MAFNLEWLYAMASFFGGSSAPTPPTPKKKPKPKATPSATVTVRANAGITHDEADSINSWLVENVGSGPAVATELRRAAMRRSREAQVLLVLPIPGNVSYEIVRGKNRQGSSLSHSIPSSVSKQRWVIVKK